MTVKNTLLNIASIIIPGKNISKLFGRLFIYFVGGVNKKKKQSSGGFDQLKEEVSMDEHRIPLEELLQRLGVDIQTGLTSERARELLAKNGPNTLTPPEQEPEWVKFCKLLFGGFSALLWVRKSSFYRKFSLNI